MFCDLVGTQRRSRLSLLFGLLFLGLSTCYAQPDFGGLPVNSSTTKTVSISVPANVTVANLAVLTVGATQTTAGNPLDFQAVDTNPCKITTGGSAATCQLQLTFTPTAPGLRSGAVVLLDNSNNPLGTTYIWGTGQGGLGVFTGATTTTGVVVSNSGNILPVAGNGYSDTSGSAGGQLALETSFSSPGSVAVDGAGNLYITDSGHNMVRLVCAGVNSAPAGLVGSSCTGAGMVVNIAGTGTFGDTGDGGPAASATLRDPISIAIDGAGNLYIADSLNNAVREVFASNGTITTIAGQGFNNACDAGASCGDGSAATAAKLSQPRGVSVDQAGNVFISDTFDNRVRAICLANATLFNVSCAAGTIVTVAGNGSRALSGDGGPATAASLYYPYAVAFDASGSMYIPDSGNNVVRVVTSSGTISRFAGTNNPTGSNKYSGDGGPATSASLASPEDVAVDPAGNVYIADNQNNAIRKVSAGPTSLGTISTFAVDNTGEYFITSDQSLHPVAINGPAGIWIDSSGNLYLADTQNNRIREIQSSFVSLDYTATPIGVGRQSAPLLQTIENDGNATLNIPTVQTGANAALSNATTCNADTLSVNVTCTIGAIFAPAANLGITSESTAYGFISSTADTVAATEASNSPLTIELVGKAIPVNPTTITLYANLPSVYGQPVTFRALVSGTSLATLTGTVSFQDGTTTIASGVALDSAGVAVFTTPFLTVGAHIITASYSGDNADDPSTSNQITQVVNEPTQTVLSSSLNPSVAGDSLTLTATVVPSNGGGVIPIGTVSFYNGGTVLGSGVLDAYGVATLATSTLPVGTDSITAVYAGNLPDYMLGSTSPTLQQQIQPATGGPNAYSVTVSPTTLTLAAGQNATVTVTVSSTTGFVDVIGLGCGSLPAAVTCHFSSPSVNLATNETQVVQLTVDTNAPLSGGTTAMNSHSGPTALSYAGLCLPIGLGFGWILRRRRKALWLVVFGISLASWGVLMTGCSGISNSKAAPGTYVIQITGSGVNSGVLRDQSLTLKITK